MKEIILCYEDEYGKIYYIDDGSEANCSNYHQKSYHNDIGPALVNTNGINEWWYYNEFIDSSVDGYNKKQFEQFLKLLPFK